MKKVFVSTTSFAEYDIGPIELLRQGGFEIYTNSYGRKLSEQEISEFLFDVDFLIAGTEPLTQRVLESAKKLKIISRCGTGLNNVDINAAERLGIKVFNTQDAPTLAVAELTVGLVLNLLRKINPMDNAMRNSKWEKLMGNLLSYKKVGIIGFGRIGRKVAKLLMPFECEIGYYDIRTEDIGLIPDEKELKVESVELDELLRVSDIILVHVSSDEQIIGAREIKQMKKGAWIVNVSRGGVIDEDALYIALKEGHLSGAALDVFEQEPYNGPLKELDNVILTPHIGSYAKEARIKMEMEAADNLLRGLGVS